MIVASKCGFDVFSGNRRVTNSASHIKEYIEGTIERLGFTPDLYYLHRIDPSMSYSHQYELCGSFADQNRYTTGGVYSGS